MAQRDTDSQEQSLQADILSDMRGPINRGYDPDEILTAAEACRVLKLSMRSFYRLVSPKNGKPQLRASKVGHDWRTTRRAIHDMLEHGANQPHQRRRPVKHGATAVSAAKTLLIGFGLLAMLASMIPAKAADLHSVYARYKPIKGAANEPQRPRPFKFNIRAV
jgi:hypothetical protein